MQRNKIICNVRNVQVVSPYQQFFSFSISHDILCDGGVGPAILAVTIEVAVASPFLYVVVAVTRRRRILASSPSGRTIRP